MAKTVAVILNSDSGSHADVTLPRIRGLFDARGIEADFHVADEGRSLTQLAGSVCRGGSEIVVAGGGDGTVSSVAAEVMKAGKVLGVLPLGTLNNFSKDLGIPQDLAAAVGVIADGYFAPVDAAEVNGQTFINNSSIGLYPHLVRHRERQQSIGRGKWWAAAWAAVKVFRVSPFLKVRLDVHGRELFRKTPFVFVGNNSYEMDIYNIGRRLSLQDGKLSIHLLRRGGRAALVMLVLRTLFGRLRQSKDFEEFETCEIEIATKRKRVLVARDGEIDVFESPLRYKILPGALKVFVPEPER